MKPILKKSLVLLLLTFLWSGVNTFAQTDSNRNKSRLDLKPKTKVTVPSVLFKKNSFAYFQAPFLTLDRSISYQRSSYINQYFTNSFFLQTTKNQPIKVESVAVQPVVAVAESKNDEFINTEDRLFSNDKLTVSNIYPNPADDHANIDYVLSSQVGEAKITFYNVLGGEMKEEVLEKDQRKIRISTKEWNNGTYIYQLSSDGKSLATKKLLVRHQ
jgi:Secretion system C-terminal sorting domain